MSKKICVFLLIFAMVSVTNAVVLRYGPGDPPTSADGPWEDANHWTPDNVTYPGLLPGAADEARINWGGNAVTVSSAVPTVWRVYPGCDESGTVIVQAGGLLDVTDCLMVAVGGNPAGNTGTIIIEAGGTVTSHANGHLWAAEVAASVGDVDVYGTLNVGGILGLGSVGFSTTGGNAYLDVYSGGVCNLSNIHSDGSSSVMNSSLFTVHGGGLATLPGDFVAVVQAYISAGKIIGTVVPVYDDFGTIIQTNITPEPATMILLGLGGLLIRRRRA